MSLDSEYSLPPLSFSVCFKAFRSTDNIIVEIVPNTDTDSILDSIIVDN